MPPTHELVTALRGAARDLAARHTIRDLDATLRQIVATAVETVPGAEAAGISIIEDGEIVSRAPTHPSVSKLDELQAELHEGPSITVMEKPPADGVISVGDLDGEDSHRWPRFAPQAVGAGFRAMLSTEVTTTGGKLRAALNLYSGPPHTFGEEAHVASGLFGAQVALLLHGSEHAVCLMAALESRDVIGRAKGILMERFGIDADDAFEMLVRSSQETDIKLVEVAEWLETELRRSRRPLRS